jgi:hypothetical protein
VRPTAQLNGLPLNLDQITALALINYGHYTSMRVGAQAGTAPVTLIGLPGVDAVVASAAVGVRPVRAIDGIQLPTDHPMIDTLAKRYAEIPPELL